MIIIDITKEISPKFAKLVTDWTHETTLALGGYGSGKSYHIAFKIVLKCLQSKVKVLVVRQVYETIKDSAFDLLNDIISDMGIDNIVKTKLSPLVFEFKNGSKIIFKGMDKPEKLKSLNGVSIVWIEECSEVRYDGYKELLGRVRVPDGKMYFILSCNPVAKENWVYRHFFARLTDEGKEIKIADEEELYNKGEIEQDDLYIHHSLPDDNPFLPREYIYRLDSIRKYDKTLWMVSRWGRFGAAGTRVLPQFEIAKDSKRFKNAINSLPKSAHYYGMDFGFESSYNAVISMAVDTKKSILYIYDEIYINKITDDVMAKHPKMVKLRDREVMIVADNEDPKAIQYYRQCGYRMRACKNKFAGSRLSNTRKIKRFKQIICSPKCINTIRELKELTYKKDTKGNVLYDDFSIDPHTKHKAQLVCINWCKNMGSLRR